MSKWRFLEPWIIGFSAGVLSIVKQPHYGWLNIIPVISGCFMFLLHRSVYEWFLNQKDPIIFSTILFSNVSMLLIPVMYREWVTLGFFVVSVLLMKKSLRDKGYLYYVMYLGAWCALAFYSIQALG